jgi:hypothetical protein
MGQYYEAAIIKDNKTTVVKHMESWDYDNGSKLMEHSYVGNSFVTVFETLLVENPQRVCWAGDYADPCKNRKTNIYSRCTDKTKVMPAPMSEVECDEFNEKYPYVVNHSTKQYINKNLMPEIPDWGAKIHPLPLLCCEGNSCGGGDYRIETEPDFVLIGTWARDKISIEKCPPKGFKELTLNLTKV